MPVLTDLPKPVPLNIEYVGSKEEILKGEAIYLQYCQSCHGAIDKDYGALPDLGHLTKAKFNLLHDIVRKGTLEHLGMPNLGNKLNDEDIENLKKYIVAKAKEIK